MPDVSVVVVGQGGLPELRACLRGLKESVRQPAEVVVVDTAPGTSLPQLLREEFPAVRVVDHPGGPGARRRARRIGIAATTGAIVGFLDGDAVPHRDWLGTLLGHFADPTVSGAGGRLLSRDPSRGPRPVLPGRVLADGTLVANFRADPGRPAVVDHLSGVNMLFRRAALDGLHDREYPGTAQWEDADLCWQVRTAGGRLVFDPRAVVHYEPGRPRGGGRQRARPVRSHYAVRNNLALLIRQGQDSTLPRRFFLSTLREQLDHAHTAVQLLRAEHPGGRLASAGPASQQLAVIGGEVSGLGLGTVDGLIGRARERKR